MNHGTKSCYAGGCRRPECREAAAVYQAEYRARKRTPEGLRAEAEKLEDRARKLRRKAAEMAGVLK